MNSRDARGGIDPQDMRTLRNQAAQDLKTAQELRQLMQQQGIRELNDINEYIKSLQALAGDRAYNDPTGLQELQASALQRVQKIELDLRKRIDKTSDQLYLRGTQDVPANSKALVDEYFRRLGRGGGK